MRDTEAAQQVAKQAARLFLTQMASAPTLAQLFAVEILAKTLFMTGVKPERRLEFLDKWLGGIRKYVVEESKPKKQPRKPNAKK